MEITTLDKFDKMIVRKNNSHLVKTYCMFFRKMAKSEIHNMKLLESGNL